LPFDVLPLRIERFVIDDYLISYLGTGRDLLRGGEAASVSPTAPVVVADPDYNLNAPPMVEAASSQLNAAESSPFRSLQGSGLKLPRLPGAAAEGREVAALLNNPAC